MPAKRPSTDAPVERSAQASKYKRRQPNSRTGAEWKALTPRRHAPRLADVSHRQDALRAELVDAQRQLLDTLDSVREDDWQRVGPNNEGWSIRDLLVHLSTSEAGFVPTLKKMAAGQGGVPQDFDPNRWNAGQSRRNVDAPPSALREQLESAHHAMLELLDTLDDTALDQRGYLSSGVEGSTEDNFRLVATHKRSHTQDMRAALSQTASSAR
jgi:uncharacterized damage-inducible protein DinB